MKLQARIDDTDYELELNETDGKLSAEVNGRKYEFESSEPEPSVFLLKENGKVYQAFVSPTADAGIQVRVGTNEFEVELTDPKRLRGAGGSAGQTDGLAEIKTAMPGKVVRILKAEGEAVAKGESVIVVEAMKMQNEMRSPKDGTISSLLVAEGETVGAGDVLLVID